MRIFGILFIALMVSVLGIAVTFLIEYPLELFYNADITYAAESYSYKPGQSGVTYTFFKANPWRGYDMIPTLNVMGIATLFHFGWLCMLSLLWRTYLRTNPALLERRKQRRAKLIEKYPQLANRFKSGKKRSFYPTLIGAAVVVFFFLFARSGQAGEKGKDPYQFSADQVVYVPDGNGTGKLLILDANTNGKGGIYLSNNKMVKPKGTSLNVDQFDPITKKRKSFFALKEKSKYKQFNVAYGNNQMWIMHKSKYLKTYSVDSGKPVITTIDEFAQRYASLNSKIHEISIQHNNDLELTTLDGQEYYYNFALDSVSSERFGKRYTSHSNNYFELKREKKKRFHLIFNHNRNNVDTFEDMVFIDAEIIRQDSSMCLLFFNNDISEESQKSIAAIDRFGKEKWRISGSDIPTRKDLKAFGNSSTRIQNIEDGKLLVLTFNLGHHLVGIMGIDSEIGAVKWTYSKNQL
jgi:hypothetical protein